MSGTGTLPAGDRYVLVSADCHAGGSMEQYRGYLAPVYRDEFDAWRGAYKNPFGDLQREGRTRNWDHDLRISELEADGIVGEVIFPNTLTPFYEILCHLSGVPWTREDYERRWAGLRAHNRWLVDFCNEVPGRRAGVGQVFLNDVDDAVAEVRWMADAGLTGGILLPGDSVASLVPLYYPQYEPLWAACADLGVPVHRHANLPGDPDTPETGHAGPVIGLIESNFFAHRGLAHLRERLDGRWTRTPTI